MTIRLRCLLSCLAVALLTATPPSWAADRSAAPDPAYVQVTNERARKIVEPMGLNDTEQAGRVQAIIAQFYRDLNARHTARDEALAAAKTQGETATALVRAEIALAVTHLHYAFLGQLASELTPAQVDQVKDGLTYGVVPLTYQVYQDMIPDLTAEQRRQIHAWLVEAREHAMDAGSSHEKHGWFGKYKGRINNFLSAAGVDLKQAERDLAQRRQNPSR